MFIDHIKNSVPALRDRIRASRIDPKNRAAFGAAAPVHGQAIRVATTEVTTEVKGGPGRALSGVVLQGDWDIGQTPLTKNSKIAYCLQHWVEGKTWEESGAYELLQKLIAEKGSADNCRTHHDVVNRYARLDTIMEQVKSSGGLEPSSEMRPGSFRECGGILIHIDREGRPVELEAEDMLAIVLQHEIDHLKGKLFIDHVSALKRQLYSRRMKKKLRSK